MKLWSHPLHRRKTTRISMISASNRKIEGLLLVNHQILHEIDLHDNHSVLQLQGSIQPTHQLGVYYMSNLVGSPVCLDLDHRICWAKMASLCWGMLKIDYKNGLRKTFQNYHSYTWLLYFPWLSIKKELHQKCLCGGCLYCQEYNKWVKHWNLILLQCL